MDRLDTQLYSKAWSKLRSVSALLHGFKFRDSGKEKQLCTLRLQLSAVTHHSVV